MRTGGDAADDDELDAGVVQCGEEPLKTRHVFFFALRTARRTSSPNS